MITYYYYVYAGIIKYLEIFRDIYAIITMLLIFIIIYLYSFNIIIKSLIKSIIILGLITLVIILYIIVVGYIESSSIDDSMLLDNSIDRVMLVYIKGLLTGIIIGLIVLILIKSKLLNF